MNDDVADLHLQSWTFFNQLRKATPEEIAEVTKPKSIMDTLIKGQVYWSNNQVYKEGHIWKFDSIKNSEFI